MFKIEFYESGRKLKTKFYQSKEQWLHWWAKHQALVGDVYELKRFELKDDKWVQRGRRKARV